MKTMAIMGCLLFVNPKSNHEMLHGKKSALSRKLSFHVDIIYNYIYIIKMLYILNKIINSMINKYNL